MSICGCKRGTVQFITSVCYTYITTSILYPSQMKFWIRHCSAQPINHIMCQKFETNSSIVNNVSIFPQILHNLVYTSSLETSAELTLVQGQNIQPLRRPKWFLFERIRHRDSTITPSRGMWNRRPVAGVPDITRLITYAGEILQACSVIVSETMYTTKPRLHDTTAVNTVVNPVVQPV